MNPTFISSESASTPSSVTSQVECRSSPPEFSYFYRLHFDVLLLIVHGKDGHCVCLGHSGLSQMNELDKHLHHTDAVKLIEDAIIGISRRFGSRVDTIWAARQHAQHIWLLQLPQLGPHPR